ncbi:class I SAM-dependent RNA methyltransferase [Prosthecomicrobium sp. N25]|uniref:class I SAM-dependent RNA methyltransferase n=1 Tax=Prosthecomicrobium sp. N25 TaxID=3129254 RepID=UPI0030773243
MQDAAIETVTVGTIGHKGDGVAETPGGKVFVPLSLPGETLSVAREGDRARIVEILAPSPDRVPAPCPHFGRCGGCSLQHWDRAAYLEFKRRAVAEALADRGLAVEVLPARALEPGTRRRAVIAVQRRADGSLVAGFRERLSHTVADATGCLVVTPAIREAMPRLVRLADLLTFDRKGAVFTIIDTETGLDVSVQDGKLPDARRQDAIATALKLGFGRVSIGAETLVEARAPIVRFGGVPVTLPSGGFLQAAAAAEATLTDLVTTAVAGAKRIADLFSGAGTFTLPMARFAHVHAVEGEARALDALTRAARQAKGLKPVSVEVRDLNRRPLMAKELARFDAVVFDPPREGAAPQAKELAKSAVPLIVAVSCNPATLARDARYLVDAGWRLDPVTPVDQFLWSHHVEAVAVFRRR